MPDPVEERGLRALRVAQRLVAAADDGPRSFDRFWRSLSDPDRLAATITVLAALPEPCRLAEGEEMRQRIRDDSPDSTLRYWDLLDDTLRGKVALRAARALPQDRSLADLLAWVTEWTTPARPARRRVDEGDALFLRLVGEAS